MCLAHASTTMERHISKIGNSVETRFYDGKNIEDPKEGMIKRELGGGIGGYIRRVGGCWVGPGWVGQFIIGLRVYFEYLSFLSYLRLRTELETWVRRCRTCLDELASVSCGYIGPMYICI